MPSPAIYTFWDYQAGAWQKNNGIRIDHLLLSPQAADRLVGAAIDKRTRALGQAVRPRPGRHRARPVGPPPLLESRRSTALSQSGFVPSENIIFF